MAYPKKPDSFFEGFVEFFCVKDGTIQTGIIYPPTLVGDGLPEKLQKMCFPGGYLPAKVECFTFVITDIDGSRRYGHVRLSEKDVFQHALCILSKLNWFEAFYSLLNEVSTILARDAKNDPQPFLVRARKESPRILQCHPGQTYELVHSETDMCSFIVPPVCPTLRQSHVLFEYFSTLRPISMMRLFAHLLHERRMLFVSSRLSRLTSCIHAAVSLIQPFVWQHLFIPVLPDTLIDYLQAPMPFLIGVHQALFERSVRGRVELGDCCVVHLDTGVIESEYDDLFALPERVLNHFRRAFQLDRTELRAGVDKERDKHASSAADRAQLAANCDALSAVFLRAMALCVGEYRNYFVMQLGEPVTFDEDRFISAHRDEHHTAKTGRFYESLRSLQMFRQFIEDRLERTMSDNGSGWDDDVFEREARALHLRADETDRRYNAWLAHSRDRLADLADRMKSKSKELQQRLREEVRKSPVSSTSPIAPQISPNSTLSVKHTTRDASPSASTAIGDDSRRVDGVIKATVLDLDQVTSQLQAGAPSGVQRPTKPIATNRHSPDLLIELTPPSVTPLDKSVGELLAKQVGKVVLDTKPTRPSRPPAPAINASANGNDNDSLLLDFGDSYAAKPSSTTPTLSVLDQFDPLTSAEDTSTRKFDSPASAKEQFRASPRPYVSSPVSSAVFRPMVAPAQSPLLAAQSPFAPTAFSPGYVPTSSWQPIVFASQQQFSASPIQMQMQMQTQSRLGAAYVTTHGGSQLLNDDDLIGL